MRILAFLTLLFAAACASSASICDYDLAADGWARAASHPEALDASYSRDADWFTNADGDFLACPDLRGANICHANYDLHKKLPDGGFETEIVVCTT